MMFGSNTCFCSCSSGTLLKVVLWGERATSFPAEETHSNGQSSPQIVIFVGTLVKSFGGLSLTGGSPCKWYINPEVHEVKRLMTRYDLFCYICFVLALCLFGRDSVSLRV